MEKLEKEILELKAQAFDIGYEIERLGALRQQVFNALKSKLVTLESSKQEELVKVAKKSK